MINYSSLIHSLLPIAKEAGKAIIEVYENGFDHTLKNDGSPVTAADQAAEKIILSGLKKSTPEIPVISEESPDSHQLNAPEVFFLVDPLDGTKEFLKRDGQGAFTVNIALIENRAPTLGVIYAPALSRMFYGAKGLGSFEDKKRIQTEKRPAGSQIAVASVSHRDAETNEWLAHYEISQIKSIGSSLKFALLACGEADVYPRFGPTMEWDTAAGDAILRSAGGMVSNPDGTPFLYGKAGYKNGAFIAKA